MEKTERKHCRNVDDLFIILFWYLSLVKLHRNSRIFKVRFYCLIIILFITLSCNYRGF